MKTQTDLQKACDEYVFETSGLRFRTGGRGLSNAEKIVTGAGFVAGAKWADERNKATVEGLREALRPFAAMLPHFKRDFPGLRPTSGVIYSVTSGELGEAELTVEMLQLAASVLAELEQAEKDQQP